MSVLIRGNLLCLLNHVLSSTEFFIDLDHANGPITLHSSIDGAVRYVRAGLQKLRQRDNNVK